MSLLSVNTVDRLDRPSAYYVGKVGACILHLADSPRVSATLKTGANGHAQNKRRRYNDRDDDRGREEDPVDKLSGATTLYVGNLYVLPANWQPG